MQAGTSLPCPDKRPMSAMQKP